MSFNDSFSYIRSAAKDLALVPLVVLAPVSGVPIVALALALAFCSLGDVILTRPGYKCFLLGLIAFAIGHLVWVVCFILILGADFTQLQEEAKIRTLLGLALLALIIARALLPRAGTLRVPVAIYICIIIAMGVTALAAPSLLVLTCALLFMASDTLLGIQTFLLTRKSRAERLVNALIWPLYWGAIVLLTHAALH